MSAQPSPVQIALTGGIDTKTDQAAATLPQRIVNARYERSGALSKRYGFEVTTSLPGPQPGPSNGYLAFDGDKFTARKSPKGVDFYQRIRSVNDPLATTHRLVGSAGAFRPELTPLPAARGAGTQELMLCDIATGDEFSQWFFYVRLEMNSADPLTGTTTYDVVIDYIDLADSRLTVREPTRIQRAISYAVDTRKQIRVLYTTPPGGGAARLILVYTTDRSAGPGRGIYWRSVLPGNNAASDVIGPEYAVCTPSSTPHLQMDLFNPAGGGALTAPASFDCDRWVSNGFSVAYATPNGLAWARVLATGDLAATTYTIHVPNFTGIPVSIAIAGATSGGSTREISWAYVSRGVFAEGFVGKFTATTLGAPTIVSVLGLLDQGPATGVVPAHTAVAGFFLHYATGTAKRTFLVGINSGVAGFRWVYGDLGAALSSNVNSIDCAWATGRPFEMFDSQNNWSRVVIPMVSWGGVLGGGAGLFADVTPGQQYNALEVNYGAKLVATFAIDEVSLIPDQITVNSPGTGTIAWQAYQNARLAMAPNVGSAMDASETFPHRVRWLTAVGTPPTPVMLELTENTSDFEFIEPGVMLNGPGVPLMLDAINGLGEIGFHTSPPIMSIAGATAATAGDGWAIGQTVQYRFQYRIVDGYGRAQVSPATDPIALTPATADILWSFKIAAYDVTLRGVRVMLDVYRTDPGENAFYRTDTVAAEGGERFIYYNDRGPKKSLLDKSVTVNVESYWMTPPCASHAFRGAFRDIIVTRENEIWPSNRRLSTTAPQFDIVNAAAWDSYESVVAGGEIDGKVIFFSRSKIGFSYEQNGTLAPFTDIPADTGALEGSRALSTHLGVFYQSAAGLRVVGRDMAIHETGLPVVRQIGATLLRGGIKVASQGEIRLRFEGDGRVNSYLVFDYFHGSIDQPCWYEYSYSDGGLYQDGPSGQWFANREIVDQVYGWDGRLLFLCRTGTLLYETDAASVVGAQYRDAGEWVTMLVRSAPMRGRTPLAYLCTIEGAVNLELPTISQKGGVTLRLLGDYDETNPNAPIVVEKSWNDAEGFDRRQLQVTADERASMAPAVALEYSDVDPGLSGDGFGYRLSGMVMIYSERDPRRIAPINDGARK